VRLVIIGAASSPAAIDQNMVRFGFQRLTLEARGDPLAIETMLAIATVAQTLVVDVADIDDLILHYKKVL
jgi:hypothetical protein